MDPLRLHFSAGKRLALVSIPSGRDVEAGSSRVLERKDIGQPWFDGVGMTKSRKDRHQLP